MRFFTRPECQLRVREVRQELRENHAYTYPGRCERREVYRLKGYCICSTRRRNIFWRVVTVISFSAAI